MRNNAMLENLPYISNPINKIFFHQCVWAFFYIQILISVVQKSLQNPQFYSHIISVKINIFELKLILFNCYLSFFLDMLISTYVIYNRCNVYIFLILISRFQIAWPLGFFIYFYPGKLKVNSNWAINVIYEDTLFKFCYPSQVLLVPFCFFFFVQCYFRFL